MLRSNAARLDCARLVPFLGFGWPDAKRMGRATEQAGGEVVRKRMAHGGHGFVLALLFVGN